MTGDDRPAVSPRYRVELRRLGVPAVAVGWAGSVEVARLVLIWAARFEEPGRLTVVDLIDGCVLDEREVAPPAC